MPYNPNDAPERAPLTFKNHVRCVVDEVITVAEAVTRGRMRQLPEGLDPEQPYWDIQYIALDAKQADGGAVNVSSGCRLFSRRQDGTYHMADKNQRPAKISRAFAGLGITAFPGDPGGRFDSWCAAHGVDTIGENPSFDTTKIVNNHFIVEKPPRNRENDRDPVNFAAPLPTAVLGPDYIFTGDVRILPPASQVNEEGQQAPSQANFRDIMKDELAQASVLKAIEGKPIQALDEALMAAGISHNIQIEGESVMASAVSGRLAGQLEGVGLVTIRDGVITLNGAEPS